MDGDRPPGAGQGAQPPRFPPQEYLAVTSVELIVRASVSVTSSIKNLVLKDAAIQVCPLLLPPCPSHCPLTTLPSPDPRHHLPGPRRGSGGRSALVGHRAGRAGRRPRPGPAGLRALEGEGRGQRDGSPPCASGSPGCTVPPSAMSPGAELCHLSHVMLCHTAPPCAMSPGAALGPLDMLCHPSHAILRHTVTPQPCHSVSLRAILCHAVPPQLCRVTQEVPCHPNHAAPCYAVPPLATPPTWLCPPLPLTPSPVRLLPAERPGVPLSPQLPPGTPGPAALGGAAGGRAVTPVVPSRPGDVAVQGCARVCGARTGMCEHLRCPSWDVQWFAELVGGCARVCSTRTGTCEGLQHWCTIVRWFECPN